MKNHLPVERQVVLEMILQTSIFQSTSYLEDIIILLIKLMARRNKYTSNIYEIIILTFCFKYFIMGYNKEIQRWKGDGGFELWFSN